MCTKLYKILAISILALLAASCQKEELQPQGEGFTATAVICESVATKVDYNTDEEANVVTQQWALNDVVFGFDNLGQTFTFKVTSINENSGKATFSLNGYEPGNATKAYAVFYPGKSGFNADGTLDVDLTSQNGILSTETPVLMGATAEIKGNKVEFNFTNQTAVIEVKKFQIEPGKTVNSLEIGGLVATGRFMVENGEMILVPDADPSTITANVNLTADGEGIVDTPVYFAALATRDAHITVAANAGGKRYDNANAVPVTNVEAGHLYYMSKKLAQVAKVGNATYSTLAEAVAACAASHKKQTITILRDFTETTLIKISDKGIVLDLSGHDTEARIEVSSELELEDSGEGGTLRYTDANVIKVNAGGKLTMNGGMVKAEYVGTKRSAISILGSTDKKAEAVFNKDGLAGMVASVHRPHLRESHVALVNESDEILWEIVQEAERTLARLAPVEVAGVVLDTRAVAHLLYHLKVVFDSLLQTFSLSNLVDALEVGHLLDEVVLYLADGGRAALAGCHEIAGRIDIDTVDFLYGGSGDRICQTDGIHLVAEKLDAIRVVV